MRQRLWNTFGLWVLLLGIASRLEVVKAQGDVEPKEEMKNCDTTFGPRPSNGVFSPGNTEGALVFDDLNDGSCGVDIDTPGIWWWVNGTGTVLRASTCDSRTQIRVKLSVFSGKCDNLRCETGTARPDYECDVLSRKPSGEWDTVSSAIDFPTKLGRDYYVLVQQADPDVSGTVWLSFREAQRPRNNDCIDAIGPLPRDLGELPGTTEDASVSIVPEGYCGAEPIYPGTWFQFMGTGGDVTLMACSEFNIDGFFFTVYNGGSCNDKSCVRGTYETNVRDPEKCTFGPARILRPLTKYTVSTRDLDRYYVYIHYARTTVEKPTSSFRLWVDDGQDGKAGSGGPGAIKFLPPKQNDKNNGGGNNNGNGNGDGNGNGNGNSASPSIKLGKRWFYAMSTLFSVFAGLFL